RANADWSQIRVVTKRLARMGIRKMHLDRRELRGAERVVESDRGVRVRGPVDEDACEAALLGRSDQAHELSLVVRLVALDADAEIAAHDCQTLVNLGQRFVPVDAGLTTPQAIQIGPAQHQDFYRRGLCFAERTGRSTLLG